MFRSYNFLLLQPLSRRTSQDNEEPKDTRGFLATSTFIATTVVDVRRRLWSDNGERRLDDVITSPRRDISWNIAGETDTRDDRFRKGTARRRPKAQA